MEAHYEYIGDLHTKVSLYLTIQDMHDLRLTEIYFGDIQQKPGFLNVVRDMIKAILKEIDK